jgi:hypothetical protein
MSLVKPGTGVNSGAESIYAEANSSQANFWTGDYNTNEQYFDPLLVGHAFIIWTRFPEWVEKEYPNFKMLSQKNFAGFDGLADIELATAPSTEGFSQNEYHVAQNLGAKPSAFNLKHLEYSGSPIKNAYQHWVTGIRDPRTGIATYPKQYGMDYRAKNHTAELMYIVTRPDANNYADKKIIEFACYWTAVMPKKIALAHFNFTKATQTVPIEIDMPFSGVMHIGAKVDDAAASLLQANQHGFEFEEENDYTPTNASSTQ